MPTISSVRQASVECYRSKTFFINMTYFESRVTGGFLFDSFHNQTFLGYINNFDIQHFHMADAKDVDKKTLLFLLANATTTKGK